MKFHFQTALFLCIAITVFAQKPMFDPPLSPRVANYKIDIALDADTKKITGSEILTWVNKSRDEINELQFHMYLNGFKNERSTFMLESGDRHRGAELEKDDGWGWIEITRMMREDTDLISNCEYIQPDDDNIHDQSVLRVKLDKPVRPGETIKLNIDFNAKLPQVFARTGYQGEFFMVGQWFPKIGVYEAAGDRYAKTGQWNCHQFHVNTEFYADFGVYEVSITLPDNYVTGATGVLTDKKINDNGTQTVSYYCEDVHDFAWTADPNYIVVEDTWRHVSIKFFAHPGRESQVERHIGAVKHALEFFAEWYGDYPYPTLSIIDPAYGGLGAGGMEYPTLITAGSFWLLPEGLRLPEMVTIHEFGHNYWYGLLANNEFEEAWLDEGINTYSEIKVMDQYYGEQGGGQVSILGLNISDAASQWMGFAMLPKRDTIYKFGWKYDRGGYASLSYNKPGLMMLTLENYLGETTMRRVMRAYFDRFRFKHPTSRDFINIVNEISGEQMDWFFDQALYGTVALDYKVDKITNKEMAKSYDGVFGNPLEIVTPAPESENDIDTLMSETDSADTDEITRYENKVIIAREGEFTFPVDILIKFSDGSDIHEKWDGKDRYIVFKYETENRVISAEVDPERKIWLDVNFLNNGKSLESSRAGVLKYTTRWLLWMQNLLHIMTIFS